MSDLPTEHASPEETDDEFSPYYDVADFRSDTWSELRQMTSRRARAEDAGRPTDKLQAAIQEALDTLEEVEAYFAFPGWRAVRQLRTLHQRGLFRAVARQTDRMVRLLAGDQYRNRDVSEIFHEDFEVDETTPENGEPSGDNGGRLYFEVLVVDDVGLESGVHEVRKRMLTMRHDQDEYVYDLVVVGSLEDAVIATSVNPNIQSVVIRHRFPIESATSLSILRSCLSQTEDCGNEDAIESAPGWALGEMLKSIRPEIDLFLVTDDPVHNVAGHTGRSFRRVFYENEDFRELHLSILRGIDDRYDAPFFNALREYSRRPTGVFHAMPISRGKSIMKSHWIRDMGDFYGDNIFLAETSATSGGLDSLLQPHGPLKVAQEKTARAFGAHKSFFVTNGTSTANKIVVQALISPNDILLVSRDCHKSHHYALVLAGAMPVYMDPYPLQEYSIYGAVPLKEIKRHLMALKFAGKLDRVRVLLLTNCTFDGIVYQPEQIMREILAIKPDMVFVWDEAWFAFARWSAAYRQRTAMECAGRLRTLFDDAEYRKEYTAWKTAFDEKDQDAMETWTDNELMPDPDVARVRVYATQSTHKTLTSFRQGSMIHVHDQDFGRLVHDAFDEAYMTHTSTSPNYQILASLDVGRRQVELEGTELVGQSISLAMTLRERIAESPALSRYFQVLRPCDQIPEVYRPSGLREFYSAETGYSSFDEAFRRDEFVVDPTRVTVHVGKTGMDGDTLRRHLMDKYDIQINKTSRNTLLFMLNIGTTRGAIAYLLEVLTQMAREFEERSENATPLQHKLDEASVASLTTNLPGLPNFSHFHERFGSDSTPEGDLRSAFFLGRSDTACEFLRLDGSVQAALASGREVISAGFVTPYPPGFPILVPGQALNQEILDYLRVLDVKEIHGYNPEFGLRVFKPEVLANGASDARNDAAAH